MGFERNYQVKILTNQLLNKYYYILQNNHTLFVSKYSPVAMRLGYS